MFRRFAPLMIVFAAASLCAGAPAAQSAKTPSVKDIVAAGTKYVAEYANKLTFILGEETYLQEQFASREHRIGSRRMKGDIYLQYLKADNDWVAVHDIAEVDGQPVTDRDELRALLAAGDMQSVARKVVDRNARFNIGSIGRNFNEPTLALLVLDASRVKNFKFTRLATAPSAGLVSPNVVTLAFEEKDGPTIVQTNAHSDVKSKGEMTIETDTGRVRWTRIEFRYGKIQASLTTIYVPDTKLDLWLPSTFTEHYEGEPDGLKEIIICNARYDNYRRFETTGRIIKRDGGE